MAEIAISKIKKAAHRGKHGKNHPKHEAVISGTHVNDGNVHSSQSIHEGGRQAHVESNKRRNGRRVSMKKLTTTLAVLLAVAVLPLVTLGNSKAVKSGDKLIKLSDGYFSDEFIQKAAISLKTLKENKSTKTEKFVVKVIKSNGKYADNGKGIELCPVKAIKTGSYIEKGLIANKAKDLSSVKFAKFAIKTINGDSGRIDKGVKVTKSAYINKSSAKLIQANCYIVKEIQLEGAGGIDLYGELIKG